MANARQKRLMQEVLDDRLPDEARQRLMGEIDRDPAGAAEFNRLRQVDRVLRSAPFEHAPHHLAVSIMARLAEGLKPQQLSHLSGVALALALALITVVLLPVLIVLSWLFLSAIGSAIALTSLIEALARLMSAVLAAVGSLAQGAQVLVEQYPAAPLLLALIPLVTWWLVRLAQNRSGDQRDETGETANPG